MNKTLAEALVLANELVESLRGHSKAEVALCPPTISIAAVKAAVAETPIKLGAQNMHFEPKGAFTGEIAPTMLQGLVEYVILGHSERRQIFAESDALVNKKVLAALAHGLKPILCVGETLTENEAGHTEAVLERQVREGLMGMTETQAAHAHIVIAYEPIWAIGTGRAATADDAQRRCWFIRNELRKQFGVVADQVRIQYGGSVTPTNAAEILGKPDVDGALVGGASLKAADFAAIVHAAS